MFSFCKKWTFILIGLFFLVFFYSCSLPKHQNNQNSIIGKWKICYSKDTHFENCNYFSYEEFNPDGSYSFYSLTDDNEWKLRSSDKWKIKGKRIIFLDSDRRSKHKINWIEEDFFYIQAWEGPIFGGHKIYILYNRM